jgi:phosphoribosylformimino-5-aminoimidazole carboxamide ribotide isomerase
MLILPAIDVMNNKAVRLLKGDFQKMTVYYEDAFEPAKLFFENGFRRIHLVDLDASRTGNITAENLVRRIKKETGCMIQFGGGIRNREQIELLINSGADKIITGSLPVTDPGLFEELIKEYGCESFIVAMDILEDKVKIKGWTETAAVSAAELISFGLQLGITEFLCTDISRDGTLEGPSMALYKRLMEEYPEMSLIASGGIGSMNDIHELENISVPMAVAGKAIYEKAILIEELKRYAG